MRSEGSFLWRNSPALAHDASERGIGPAVETSTWQQTTLSTERHPCPRRDSNPQSACKWPQTYALDRAVSVNGRTKV